MAPVLRLAISVRDTMELAWRLALAAGEWDEPTIFRVSWVAAHADAAVVFAGDDPIATGPSGVFGIASSHDQFPLSALARAVRDDLHAARTAEQHQDHRR